jgi:8-oxo-dGTP pyrophosphatase MutT (NUDIX family)
LDRVLVVDEANEISPTLAAEEIVDLVDEDDHVVGQAPRREVRTRNLLHREVAAIVRNPVGEIYVHRRTDTKDVFPGMYDMFVAGVVTSDESYEEAIRRELAEELGVQGVEPTLLFKSRYRDPDINWWTCCYEECGTGPSVIRRRRSPGGGSCPRRSSLPNLMSCPSFLMGSWSSDDTWTSQAAESSRSSWRSHSQRALGRSRTDVWSAHRPRPPRMIR